MKYKLIINQNAEEEIVATVHAPSALTQQIENLICKFSGADSVMGYDCDGMQKLEFSQIECIAVINRKVTAIDVNGDRFTLKERLRDLEPVLPSYFIRINKSAVANEHHVKRFDTTFSGGVDAVFMCGYRDYVSRRCFAEIKRRYEKI
ncbi:MAG: LytTR family transcriptional regulator [Clostridia bacterium]|nr:LytTR family transcriptional regulator [Clostridia bacterium]